MNLANETKVNLLVPRRQELYRGMRMTVSSLHAEMVVVSRDHYDFGHQPSAAWPIASQITADGIAPQTVSMAVQVLMYWFYR